MGPYRGLSCPLEDDCHLMQRSDIARAESPRADRLVRLRDIVVLASRRQITNRSRLVQAAIDERVFTREDDQAEYGYSSIYRYLDTLRFLELDVSRSYDI